MSAQGVRISGTVERVAGARTVALGGVWVVLHRISRTGAGPHDSVPADGAGAYRFTVPRDTGVQFVVAARYAGVAYVSEPIEPGAGPARVEPLVVYDTTSRDPVLVLQRQVLVQGALPDGSRPVVELIVLRNPGSRTVVGPDSASPTWETRLAAGAMDVVVSQGDLGHEAAHAHGDVLEVLAPLPPGEREVVVTYLLPASRVFRLPVDQAVADLGLMVADTTATAATLESLGITSFEGTRYLRLQGRDVAPLSEVVVRLSAAPVRAEDFWWLVVLAAAATLVGTLAWWRRHDARARDPESQAAQIAVQDGARVEDPEWPGRRRRLVATLAATLANRADAP